MERHHRPGSESTSAARVDLLKVNWIIEGLCYGSLRKTWSGRDAPRLGKRLSSESLWDNLYDLNGKASFSVSNTNDRGDVRRHLAASISLERRSNHFYLSDSFCNSSRLHSSVLAAEFQAEQCFTLEADKKGCMYGVMNDEVHKYSDFFLWYWGPPPQISDKRKNLNMTKK